MKKYANELIAGDSYHPAEFILDEMEAQGLRQIDLVRISGFNKSFVSLLLKGERNITTSVALALESTLNIPAEFWIRLQKNYELQRDLIELKDQTAKSGAVANKNVHISERQKTVAMEPSEKYSDASSSASDSGSEFDEK